MASSCSIPGFFTMDHILHINSYKLVFLNDLLSRSSFFSYFFSGSMRSPSRRWNKSKLSFSTWTVSTWESSSWDVWNSKNWWYVWYIYIYTYIYMYIYISYYIKFISYLYHIYIIYHISYIYTYIHIYIYIIYHHFPQIAIVGGTVVTPFLDALHKTTSVTECTCGRQGRWRSWNETSGSTSRFMNRRSGRGPAPVREETRRTWVYEDIKLVDQKALFFCCNRCGTAEMARPEI